MLNNISNLNELQADSDLYKHATQGLACLTDAQMFNKTLGFIVWF